jgi:hypothetical protein
VRDVYNNMLQGVRENDQRQTSESHSSFIKFQLYFNTHFSPCFTKQDMLLTERKTEKSENIFLSVVTAEKRNRKCVWGCELFSNGN